MHRLIDWYDPLLDPYDSFIRSHNTSFDDDNDNDNDVNDDKDRVSYVVIMYAHVASLPDLLYLMI